MLGIQNHRLAQCHYAQLTLRGPDTLPVQVDGEAWLQEPGTIVISHKNKARMLVKDKVRGWVGVAVDEGRSLWPIYTRQHVGATLKKNSSKANVLLKL